MTKKRRKQKKKRHIKRTLLSLAAAPFLLLGGAGGYEYYTTGSVSETAAFLEKIPAYVQQVPAYLKELPRKAQEIPESIERLSQQAEKLADSVKQRAQGAETETTTEWTLSADGIPEYTGKLCVELSGNVPSFTDEEQNGPSFAFYSELDSLGRCGYAEAKITPDMMPTEERGEIGMIKPSGWHTVKYDGIDGNYLYNRCHLIGYQLTGENANEKNLITGTRCLNVEGMLPWENLVGDYIRDTGDAVLYRVTPVFEGDNLLASGVQMEAKSLGSDEICFNVFVFNVQPGISIDYADGSSWRTESETDG